MEAPRNSKLASKVPNSDLNPPTKKKVPNSDRWAVMGSGPNCPLMILNEICLKLFKTVLKCVETWNMHSSAKNLAQIRQKTIGWKKKGIKGHLGPLMASDGQTAHHYPSPAILLCFSLSCFSLPSLKTSFKEFPQKGIQIKRSPATFYLKSFLRKLHESQN